MEDSNSEIEYATEYTESEADDHVTDSEVVEVELDDIYSDDDSDQDYELTEDGKRKNNNTRTCILENIW